MSMTSYSISFPDTIEGLQNFLRQFFDIDGTPLSSKDQDYSDLRSVFEHTPISNPFTLEDIFSIYDSIRAGNEQEKFAREQQTEEEVSLDADPDLTGDDDLENGTVPTEGGFNADLKRVVDTALEGLKQQADLLEEMGASAEEIEELKTFFTALPQQTQQGGPIDLGTLPDIPTLPGSGAVITVENGLDDIFIELKLDLPVIGKLLETLGLGDSGKIHLRRGGRWSTPGDVLGKVGEIFTGILTAPKAIVDEAAAIIEEIKRRNCV